MIKSLLFLLFICPLFCSAQRWTVTADLQHQWYVRSGSKYETYHEGKKPQAIYIFIDSAHCSRQYLQIRSKYPFSVFIDHQFFIQSDQLIKISLDSLKTENTANPIMIH